MTDSAFILLAALMFVHFLGDFTRLNTPAMIEAKVGDGPVELIAVHALIHAALAALVVWAVVRPGAVTVLLAGSLELTTHFAIDVGRAAVIKRAPRFRDADGKPFWTLLGADQMLHGVVLLGIVRIVL